MQADWAEPTRNVRAHVLANRRRYARLAPIYDLLDRAFERKYAVGRVEIGTRTAGLTLEVGAGTGKNFPYYRAGYRASAGAKAGAAASPDDAGPVRVYASDLSQRMLARARLRQREPVRALLAAEAGSLPFGGECADTVVATFVTCVQDDPAPLLTEVARVLKPGGQVLCLDYTVPQGWDHLAVGALMRLIERPLRAVYGIHWGHDVPRLLQNAGLRVREVRRIWGSAVRLIAAEKPATRPWLLARR